ncbi:MAG: hypothetical protein JRL30_25525 [Deltaproteobacteria bacterium]|nr:hypothetical protein [Deltaproteobacteria bacterium]
MQIKHIMRSQLPKLAWLADTHLDTGTAYVYHGDRLEVQKTFFIEGTWNGDFDKGEFDQTECVFGTGAVLKRESIIFVSSATTTDALFYRSEASRCIVSNSLPFILAFTGDSLDPTYHRYHVHNESILGGINRYDKTIRTTKGKIAHLFFRNLEVNNLGPREIDKPLPEPFNSYHDYYHYLVNNYHLITTNIRSERRATKLSICSTQSKGYDTTAINAVSSLFGIDKVFTCTKAKGEGAYADRDKHLQQDDDGSEICKSLGLHCTPVDRRAYEIRFADEYLYYASQHENQDANFVDIVRRITPITILLTGVLGEIWYTSNCARNGRYYIDSELKRWDLGGHGLSEVRLQSGFIQLPFPYMGAQRREDIQKISDAPEMRPWRLNNHYDRPIPRRMAEERGVPRALFGQTKLATVVEFAPPRIPKNISLRKDYFAFLTGNRIAGRLKIALFPLVHFINTMITFKFTKRYRIIYFAERLISRLRGKPYTFPLLWKDLNGSLFCFAVNKRLNDYKDALTHNNSEKA